MMMLAGLFFLSNVFAQDTTYKQTIRGRIIDQQTHTPLIGANVVLNDKPGKFGTTTNKEGRFKLTEVPVGRHTITVSYMGYQPAILKNIEINSAKEKMLTIKLKESVQQVEEVVVKGQKNKSKPINDMSTVSARSFTIEETEKYAGSWGDPARMASNYAGVYSANDQRNDIIIRGNSPTGLLWRLEDLNIHNPNHFGALGSTGGPVSILNNNTLARSDFFSGAFPAEYGNAIGGAFDLRMRNGNNEQYEFLGQVGFNGFEAGAEGPLSKSSNASFLANYRYSTLGIMDEIGLDPGYGAIPHYQDLTMNINIPLQNGNLKVFGLGGLSNITFHNEYNTSENEPSKELRLKNGSDLGVMGIKYSWNPGNGIRWKNVLGVSSQRLSTTGDSLVNGEVARMQFSEKDVNTKWEWTSQFIKKLGSQNTIKAGLIADDYMFRFQDKSYSTTHQKYLSEVDIDKNHMFFLQSYGQWEHRFSNRLILETGIHSQHLLYTNSHALEPRVGLDWHLTKKHSFSFGYGYHSQLQPLFYYFIQTYLPQQDQYITTNTDLDFTNSHHWVAGYDYQFNPDLRLKTEIYYQALSDIPIETKSSTFSMANVGASFYLPRKDSLTNKGKGTNYGIEFTVEKFLNNNYYFLMTASLFESKYTNNTITRNTAFNGNFSVNVLGGYEFSIGPKGAIDINLRLATSGGRRVIPIDKKAERSENSQQTVYDYDRAYEEQLNTYFRIDARIGYKTNDKNITQEWAIDITNLTNHKNVFSREWNEEEESLQINYQQGFFPVGLYRIYF